MLSVKNGDTDSSVPETLTLVEFGYNSANGLLLFVCITAIVRDYQLYDLTANVAIRNQFPDSM